MLDTILADARRRAAALHGRLDDLREAATAAPPARDFSTALTAPGLRVVAEFKRRSPSAGDLGAADPAAQAERYAAGGAAAISVLTDPDHFAGSLDDLRRARDAVDLPVLRKDFVLTAEQVWEARAAGADAVLLITSVLDDQTLRRLVGECSAAGMTALVEVHSPAEARRATSSGATVVGVNNRDLTTFATDLAVAERVASLLGDVIRVAESGVSGEAGAARMAAAGYDAILVGEALMRSEDPAEFIRRLTSAGVRR